MEDIRVMPSADPRMLLKFHYQEAIRDAAEAMVFQHGAIRTAQGAARGSRVNYLNLLSALASIRAVELYRRSSDRKEEQLFHRRSQRTATRRQATPLTRAPRRPHEWDGSPNIPADNASELSVGHADEWRSLVLLGFFFAERKKKFDWTPLLRFEVALRSLYIERPDVEVPDIAHIRDNIRQTVSRRMRRQPSQTLYRFHKIDADAPNSAEHLALTVLKHWREVVEFERSGRAKSKPLRRAN